MTTPSQTSIIPSGMHSCAYCGPNVYHSGQCPKVSAISYHPDGTVARVEFRSQVEIQPDPWKCPSCGCPLIADHRYPDPYCRSCEAAGS